MKRNHVAADGISAPRAAADLDDIWYYVAKESGSSEVAGRLIDSLTNRFLLLAEFPQAGRPRDDFGPDVRTFPVGEYLIVYEARGSDVSILRVVHGRRDVEELFG